MHLILTVCFLLFCRCCCMLPVQVAAFQTLFFFWFSPFSATALTSHKLLNKSYSLLQR